MKDESVLTNWFISSDSIIINNSHEERHTLEERKLINIKGRMDVEGRGEAYLYSLISKAARLCIATAMPLVIRFLKLKTLTKLSKVFLHKSE